MRLVNSRESLASTVSLALRSADDRSSASAFSSSASIDRCTALRPSSTLRLRDSASSILPLAARAENDLESVDEDTRDLMEGVLASGGGVGPEEEGGSGSRGGGGGGDVEGLPTKGPVLADGS